MAGTTVKRLEGFRETDAALAAEQANYNERALAATTPGGYEKWSNRANDVEGVRLRLAAKRGRLESRLSAAQA